MKKRQTCEENEKKKSEQRRTLPEQIGQLTTRTVNPLYNDIRYNSTIRYNVNLVCTKISGSCIFFIVTPMLFFRKHTFCVFVRVASERRF